MRKRDLFRLLLFFLICGAPAWGEGFHPTANLGLDMRLDYTSTQTHEDHVGAQVDQFVAPNPRINLLGGLDDSTTYRIRFDASGVVDGTSSDSLAKAFNYLYLTHKVSDLITVRAGKQFIVSSGWEFNYDTSKIYHYGETFLKLPAWYATGLAVEFHFADQIIGLQAANADPDADVSTHQHSSELTHGIYWYGNFANSRIQPIASMVWYPRVRGSVNGNIDEAAVRTQYAIGSRFDLKPVDFDLTVGTVGIPEYTYYDSSGAAKKQNKEDWLGVVFNAHYREEGSKWQPFTKVTYDESRVSGQKSAKDWRYSVGVEYYPESDKWWYHLTYTHQDNDASAVAFAPNPVVGQDQSIDVIRVGAGIYFY